MLPKPMKLALLTEQNAKLELDSDEVNSNVDRQVHGEMVAMERHGIIATKLALDASRKTKERSEIWASRGRHRAYKKTQKAINSLGKDADAFAQFLGGFGDMNNEFEEDEIFDSEAEIVEPDPA